MTPSRLAPTGPIFRPGRGTSYGGIPRIQNCSSQASIHALASVRIADEDTVMEDYRTPNTADGNAAKPSEGTEVGVSFYYTNVLSRLLTSFDRTRRNPNPRRTGKRRVKSAKMLLLMMRAPR